MNKIITFLITFIFTFNVFAEDRDTLLIYNDGMVSNATIIYSRFSVEDEYTIKLNNTFLQFIHLDENDTWIVTTCDFGTGKNRKILYQGNGMLSNLFNLDRQESKCISFDGEPDIYGYRFCIHILFDKQQNNEPILLITNKYK